MPHFILLHFTSFFKLFDLLFQVIRNVLSNAVKFSYTGGTVEVVLSVRDDEKNFRREERMARANHFMMSSFLNSSRYQIHPDSSLNNSGNKTGKFVRIDVKDSGYGISADNVKKLFTEVIQFEAKAQQGGGGSGLGLWISKRIVDLHEGFIGVSSEGVGQGCTFTIEIPLVDAPPSIDTNESVKNAIRMRGRSDRGIGSHSHKSGSGKGPVPVFNRANNIVIENRSVHRQGTVCTVLASRSSITSSCGIRRCKW